MKNRMSINKKLLVLSNSFLLSACASTSFKDFDIKNLAKSEAGKIYELVVVSQLESVKALMVKLYRKNPRELRKAAAGVNLDSRLAQVFSNDGPHWIHPELEGKASITALELAFNENFTGDRVFAFTVGLGSMIIESYDNKYEFFVLDHISSQKIYASARNIEIANWRLNNKRLPNNGLMLLSNSYGPDEINISYDRLVNRIIDYQDLVVDILGGSSSRRIGSSVLKLATAVFIPI
jgi:hypothetical protein